MIAYSIAEDGDGFKKDFVNIRKTPKKASVFSDHFFVNDVLFDAAILCGGFDGIVF